jgi:hypothetical protein
MWDQSTPTIPPVQPSRIIILRQSWIPATYYENTAFVAAWKMFLCRRESGNQGFQDATRLGRVHALRSGQVEWSKQVTNAMVGLIPLVGFGGTVFVVGKVKWHVAVECVWELKHKVIVPVSLELGYVSPVVVAKRLLHLPSELTVCTSRPSTPSFHRMPGDTLTFGDTTSYVLLPTLKEIVLLILTDNFQI